jgi:valyl-tRNA synthetase
MEINKIYEPNKIEKKWYQEWTDKGYFTPEIDESKKPFTVLIPPPNVTGILHMGHVLNNTIQDVLIRYKRMTGIPTLWLPGTDHAGIATQNVVEKNLHKEGTNRHEIGRQALVERIWEFKHEKGGRIIEQLKKLGCSCDWSKERFTMDEGLSDAVKEVFIHLYNKGLIYRGKRIINWCPRCVTALANDEVEHNDEAGKLWHIKYPYADASGYIEIATTRPETMLGDVAVAVNPKDERYKDLIGKELSLPYTGRTIPLIADDYVDKDFGSGCVKITPAHDPNDFEVGQRHNLAQILVIDEHGIMNENAGTEFTGLDRYECRNKLIKMLENDGLLIKTQDHNHAVGHCYRCDTVIEPYLSDQWFVSMEKLAQPAIEVVRNGQVKFQPERWTKVYMHWMENVRDWCISRQIWWGHRIPAFYCDDCGEIMVTKEAVSECSKCHSKNIRQEEDVLDTWFSSWLWPFSTLGWPEKTKELDYFLPTDVLVTGHEIIYLWVARMIMATLEFEQKIPFHTVFLHGIVRDEIGRKMSKSLGNSPDPINIIDEVGADALRFSMIFNTPKGQDSYYSDSLLETGRNFANKIWNAFRYIMMNVEKIEGLPKAQDLKLELADKWIYSRLNQVIKEVTENYENLRQNDSAQTLMQFIWNDFCSWYIELSKDRIYDENDKDGQLTAKYVLLDVLQQSMRLLHPLMPFITEEVWNTVKVYFPMDESALIVAKFPQTNESLVDLSINDNMSFVQETITAIRNLRKQVNLSPALEIEITINVAEKQQEDLFNEYQNYFAKLAKVNKMNININGEKVKGAIAGVVRNIEIYLPLSGLVDLEKEEAKLEKQITKLEKELSGIERKLANEKFIQNAKPEVVEKEKEKYNEVKSKLDTVKELYESLK